MRIEAYILMWNEEFLLPFTLRHYAKFCDRIVCFDNYSDDNSAAIARHMGAEVIPFGIKGKLDDREYLKVKNSCWKGSQADFVFVGDCDELLWDGHSVGIQKTVIAAKAQGADYIPTLGWGIYASKTPSFEATEILFGRLEKSYDKMCCFNPQAFTEINYRPGAHRCDPLPMLAQLKPADKKLFLLHYRKMGGVRMYLDRCRQYTRRMSAWNRMKGHGIHYLFAEPKIMREHAHSVSLSTERPPLELLYDGSNN